MDLNNMVEQGDEVETISSQPDSLEPTTDIKEPSEQEKKLRRELARYREQVRMVQSEREAACAAAVRERDEAIAAVREDARARIIQAELKTCALRAGIVDLDVLQLADLSKVSLTDDGSVEGVDQAIHQLRENKPYLFNDRDKNSVNSISGRQRAPNPSMPEIVDARTMSREAWQVARSKIVGART